VSSRKHAHPRIAEIHIIADRLLVTAIATYVTTASSLSVAAGFNQPAGFRSPGDWLRSAAYLLPGREGLL